MASVKVKFSPSTASGKEGTIYYQIIQNRVIRQLKTEYRIFTHEWDAEKEWVITSTGDRCDFLQSVQERINWDIKRLQSIISKLENNHIKYTADDIISTFHKSANEQSLFNFMQGTIVHLKQMRKTRTAENYPYALKSFMQFRQGKDVPLSEIDSDLMQLYEAHPQGKGTVRNTSSFYLRIFRAVYNRALEKGLIEQRNPFRHVYTGVDKTVKRAIPLPAIKRMKCLDLSLQPNLKFARDMFLFSFYTRGMAFVDMAYLKKKDLQNGTLSYRRRKTGQQLLIKWEKQMQEIINKHPTDDSCTYLLPILKYPYHDIHKHYRNILSKINRNLKVVAKLAGITTPLSMYCARHSWASTAKGKHIPLAVISEGMGHDSESTTQIYLASLDNVLVDNANTQILKSL